ncbi:MAG: hypothetical protein A3F70_06325 [Acidobacteria bacterium RIFCSPLOWO2_12_FULL_67_14]|nr:MAG: hypothetical protein A3H29_01900 [Acidobacteria bacterium RIFCSPLOWO2_02_FULL_67_21]OFW37002.1 MAG: hypothetical protein A3F70_06325 [Acidobacteria bacterium RIFCSPLOWO2_12_FULL_67_14]
MVRGWLVIAVVIAAVSAAHAQFGGFGRAFRGSRIATAGDFDGRFHYCRVVYTGERFGRGGSWATDYPNADINLSVRLSELTKIPVSRAGGGAPNPLLVRLGGEEMFQCPLTILSAPGSAFIEADVAARLREYLLKGGMLWTDDSWGTYQWQHWQTQLRKVLPSSEYPIFDVPLDHPLFRTQYEVTEIPQIPNIGFFLRSGGRTSEQGADSAVPQLKGIADRTGRLMVMMTHNTDIADSWEREGEDPSYFYAFSPRGYAFAINAVLYAHTH